MRTAVNFLASLTILKCTTAYNAVSSLNRVSWRWYNSAVPARKQAATLTVAQAEIATRFADHSFDYPNLLFDEVAQKVPGPKPFSNTPNGRAFRREAKAIFDQERET